MGPWDQEAISAIAKEIQRELTVLGAERQTKAVGVVEGKGSGFKPRVR